MRILITAGGTREYIDPVRFISNASSGKMGYALAHAALKAGHKVTLISASDLQPQVGIDFVGVDSADDMFSAVKKLFAKCDCLIMAAAVADYTPVALEDKDLRINAEKKLKEKNLDMVIANSTTAVGADKSTVHIKTINSSWLKIENATKATIAGKIIVLIEKVFS